MNGTQKSHSSSDSAEEDVPVRHYDLKNRLISWFSRTFFDHITYTVRHGLLQGMKRKGGLGWLPPALAREDASAESKFWNEVSLDGLTVYDVGAFHGLLTLLFASRARRVVSFEPNSRNYARPMENIALNGLQNVEVRRVGVGSKPETRDMVASPLSPGGASLDSGMASGLRNSGTETLTEEISIVSLDDDIRSRNLPKPNFIKIDVEGWELEVLRGAQATLSDCKPILFIEMHGETIREKKRKVAEIVDFLWAANYRSIVHVETGKTITPENSAVAIRGHLHCR